MNLTFNKMDYVVQIKRTVDFVRELTADERMPNWNYAFHDEKCSTLVVFIFFIFILSINIWHY